MKPDTVALASLALVVTFAWASAPAQALPGESFKATLQKHRANTSLRGLHRAARDPNVYEFVKFSRAYDVKFEVFSHNGQETHAESLGIATGVADKAHALLPTCEGGTALIGEYLGQEVVDDYRNAIMFKETDRRFFQGAGSPDNLYAQQRYIGRKYAYYLLVDEGVSRQDLDGSGATFKAFAKKTRRGSKFLNWYSLSVEPFQDAIAKYPWLLDKYPQLLTPAERARRISGSR